MKSPCWFVCLCLYGWLFLRYPLCSSRSLYSGIAVGAWRVGAVGGGLGDSNVVLFYFPCFPPPSPPRPCLEPFLPLLRRCVSCLVVSGLVVSCLVVSRRVVSCLVLSCRVVSCLVVSCRVVFIFSASNGVPYPVYIPRGPASQGHRRMMRFVENMQSSVWGFDADKVRYRRYCMLAAFALYPACPVCPACPVYLPHVSIWYRYGCCCFFFFTF